MPSPIAQFLANVFPTVKADLPQVPSCCWISKVLQRDPPGLAPLSKAVAVVAHCGQLPALTKRMGDEHPVDRPHQEQYDERLLDCLTVACGFAWALLGHFGWPKFLSE